MTIAIAKDSRLSAGATSWCDEHSLDADARTALELRALLARVDHLEISQDTVDDLEHLLPEDPEPSAETLRAATRDAVIALNGYRRDVTSVFIAKTWWLATGGLSWGDTPTDAYDLILLVSELEVTERAVSLAEIKAAAVVDSAAAA
ncbi:hypothetical protein DC31_05935 [Microbacterium sp. CH12i]|uniref:hypothetical protein n=1 Tax=Microbacterium sp. CH12i TaxID=1479651 RepID=UPI000461C472|nr:hypothetical protein [Microbacterium sp. CH12i]KDA04629.1 hypothetical protein DC31_05935 [Microbacterium sp. CH12i]